MSFRDEADNIRDETRPNAKSAEPAASRVYTATAAAGRAMIVLLSCCGRGGFTPLPEVSRADEAVTSSRGIEGAAVSTKVDIVEGASRKGRVYDRPTARRLFADGDTPNLLLLQEEEMEEEEEMEVRKELDREELHGEEQSDERAKGDIEKTEEKEKESEEEEEDEESEQEAVEEGGEQGSEGEVQGEEGEGDEEGQKTGWGEGEGEQGEEQGDGEQAVGEGGKSEGEQGSEGHVPEEGEEEGEQGSEERIQRNGTLGYQKWQGFAEDIPVVELEYPRQIQGALALKSEKIVYCPIQKVACTEWLKVFRWIDGKEDWQKPMHTNHGLAILKRLGIKRTNEILNRPDWVKFAVVREPAERLLSCFYQKCNKYGFRKEYPNCPYMDLWPDLFVQGERFPAGRPKNPNEDTMSVIVEAFTTRGRDTMFQTYVQSITTKLKTNACKQNGHWSPQWCHCSLDLTYPVYRIVGWDNMADGALEAISPAISSPERRREITDFINGRMQRNNESKGKKTGAKAAVEKVYSKDMLQMVREAYAKDYELFSQYWEYPQKPPSPNPDEYQP